MVAATGLPNASVHELVALDFTPGVFWFGAWRNLTIGVWSGDASVDVIRRIDATNPERTQAHPEGISTVHIVTPTANPPDAATRAALNDMHARWGHTVGCAVVVIEHGGLAGAAVRGAVTGMAMLAPKRYRLKVFDTIAPVTSWLVEQHARSTGVQLNPQDVIAVLRRARAAGT